MQENSARAQELIRRVAANHPEPIISWEDVYKALGIPSTRGKRLKDAGVFANAPIAYFRTGGLRTWADLLVEWDRECAEPQKRGWTRGGRRKRKRKWRPFNKDGTPSKAKFPKAADAT